MRLSEWRAASPSKDAGGTKVAAVVDPVLRALGAGPDPESFVVWGEEPGSRYTILVPTAAGLILAYVRTSVPGEGPRATAKLIRWSRVQLGELSLETQGEHRLLGFQLEGIVLNGSDEKADRIARFALGLFASVDGRELPPEPVTKRGAAKASLAAASRKAPAPATARKGGASGTASRATKVAFPQPATAKARSTSARSPAARSATTGSSTALVRRPSARG